MELLKQAPNKLILSRYFPFIVCLDIPARLGTFKGQKAIELSVDNKTLTTISENFSNKGIKESGILTGKKKFDAVNWRIDKIK